MRRKIAFLVTVIVFFAALLWAKRFFGPPISDRELLREALNEDEKSASVTGRTLSWDVFCQQAAQGYYDDATATILRSNQDREVQYALVRLAGIRAKNGDFEGALRTSGAYSNSDTREKAIQEVAIAQTELGDALGARQTALLLANPSGGLEAIAIVQADKGDVQGACETIAALSHPNRALEAIGEYQVRSGDFEGALKTAEEIGPESTTNLLFDVGYELQRRGEQNQVRRLASEMSNPQVARLFLYYCRYAQSSLENIKIIGFNTCEIAEARAAQGEFQVAYDLIKQTKCSYSFIAIKQYATDPADAEREVMRNPNPVDVCFGLTEIAKKAGAAGNVSDALRLVDKTESVCGGKYGYSFGAISQVARFWTIKDGPNPAVKWARSRKSAPERYSALFGIAVALGHPHP